MTLYRHPPRTRRIKLAENIHSLIANKSSVENHPLYTPTAKDGQNYGWNGDDGYLRALIKEVISNGYNMIYVLNVKKMINVNITYLNQHIRS